MSNVIHVEFGKKNTEQESSSFHPLYELTSVPDTSSLTAYLDSLRMMGAEDEDILEVIEAINDVDAYFAADDEVKAFADGWLHQFL
jgi:hypothetical protein